MRRPIVGAVVQVGRCPHDRYAFGRVYRDASVGFYRARSTDSGQPPIGSRDFAFFVGVDDEAFKQLRVVGTDPFEVGEDEWPPPSSIRDPITGRYSAVPPRSHLGGHDRRGRSPGAGSHLGLR